jgi:hypothetical protein
VPDAPFKTTWPALAMKRMIRLAAERGMDKIGWTTGEQQAERYDLSKQIQRVTLEPAIKGSGSKEYLAAYDHNGRRVVDKAINSRDEIADYIGKEAAQKLVDAPVKRVSAQIGELGDTIPRQEISGLDLRVGGEGMRGFYDKILPSVAAELGKKFGVKPTQETIPSGDNVRSRDDGVGGLVKTYQPAGLTVHSMDITPEMRASALQGMPLFQPATKARAPLASIKTKPGVLAGAGIPRKKKALAK